MVHTTGGERHDVPTRARELDSETGLQLNRARVDRLTLGRWTIQDPLGFDAGDLNLYRYVHNSPPNSTDQSGCWIGLPLPWPIPGWTYSKSAWIDCDGKRYEIGANLPLSVVGKSATVTSQIRWEPMTDKKETYEWVFETAIVGKGGTQGNIQIFYIHDKTGYPPKKLVTLHSVALKLAPGEYTATHTVAVWFYRDYALRKARLSQ